VQPARKTNNLTAIYEPILLTVWDPQHNTHATLYVSLGIRGGLFPSGVSSKIPYAFLFALRATFPAPLLLILKDTDQNVFVVLSKSIAQYFRHGTVTPSFSHCTHACERGRQL
jgi:hypothetical protein